MKVFAYIAFSLALITSCTEQYNIAGISSVRSLDGRMLYLRVNQGNDGVRVVNIDSCEVVHGRFSFYNNLDTIMMAQLFMGNESFMPLVLESGDINVRVDHVGQRVSGGPLNDRLYKFVEKKNRLENKMWELDQKCLRMMHEGHSPDAIRRIISPKAKKIAKQVEALETKFIKDNYDNPLGPGCFMLLFGQYPLPVMTDQIRNIIKTASPAFLQNPFVNSYLRRVRLNSYRRFEYELEDGDDFY